MISHLEEEVRRSSSHVARSVTHPTVPHHAGNHRLYPAHIHLLAIPHCHLPTTISFESIESVDQNVSPHSIPTPLGRGDATRRQSEKKGSHEMKQQSQAQNNYILNLMQCCQECWKCSFFHLVVVACGEAHMTGISNKYFTSALFCCPHSPNEYMRRSTASSWGNGAGRQRVRNYCN